MDMLRATRDGKLGGMPASTTGPRPCPQAQSSMTRCAKCRFESEEPFKFCPDCGARYRDPGSGGNDDPFVGLTLKGKYKVRRKVGSGAMGTVYEAEHVQLQKTVALKILHPNLQLNEESLKRFQQEGVVAGRFSHPNAIQVFDFDQAESGALFLAMEYVRGPTLREYLTKFGAQAPHRAARIMAQVLEVLAAAHREGIVHRDLKPDNIMVTDEDGDVPSVKVLDFGVSKIVDLHNENTLMTHTGQILGTPLYMAPEQCSGEAMDHRGDLYACGVILFELMAGRTPFTGKNVTELLYKHTTEEIPALQTLIPQQPVPEDVEQVLHRALEKDRERRYQDADEMLADLATIRFERLVKTSPLRRTLGSVGKAVRRRRGLLVSAAASALVVLTATWIIQNLDGATAVSYARVSLKPEEALTDTDRFYLSLVRRVRQELERGQDADARDAIGELFSMQAQDAEAYLLRGMVYERYGDLQPARQDYEEALRLDSSFAEAHCALGWMDHTAGFLDSALASFQKAERLGGRESEALTGLAVVLLDRGERERARGYLEQAIAGDDSHWRPHLELGRLCRESGQAEDSLASLVEAQRLNDSAPGLYLELSRTYQLLGDMERATGQAREAVARQPDDEDSVVQLARVLLHQELHDDARQELSNLLRRRPDCDRARVLLGVAYHGLQEIPLAIQELATGLKGHGEDADAWALLGTLQQMQGLPREAAASFDSALLVNRRHPVALYHLGLLAFDQERYEEAADLMERSASAEPRTTTHLALGVVYLEYLGDRESAELHFRRFQDLGGENPRVDQFLRIQAQSN